FFPDGVVASQIQILPPGWVTEDGSGPPGKPTAFTAVKEWTAAEKKKINDDIKKDFPNVTVAADPTRVYDCHGYTFKSKKMRILNEAIDTVLVDQGWVKAADKKHQVGDIVIYRDAQGRVTHSGVVEEVGADGNVSKVHSKW